MTGHCSYAWIKVIRCFYNLLSSTDQGRPYVASSEDCDCHSGQSGRLWAPGDPWMNCALCALVG